MTNPFPLGNRVFAFSPYFHTFIVECNDVPTSRTGNSFMQEPAKLQLTPFFGNHSVTSDPTDEYDFFPANYVDGIHFWP